MDKYRMERIERLFHELKYEITRGLMEGDIEQDQYPQYRFMVPLRDGTTLEYACLARRSNYIPISSESKLKLVKTE